MSKCAEEFIKIPSEGSQIVFEVWIVNKQNKNINIWKWLKGCFRREMEEISIVVN